MSYFTTKDPAECCGCGACYQVCPKQCISMQPDKKGFLYPVIDQTECIHCHLCEKVCPEDPTVRAKGTGQPELFGAVHREQQVLMQSASGGAFPAIVQSFCDEDSVIFGVQYDENMRVCHSYVIGKDAIGKFKKSKYVQSDTGKTFRQAKEFLEQGKKVLFTGTPCQISGLKAFLRKDYENLLTVDLICHGVASPALFADYIALIEKKYHKKVVWADMRTKEKVRGNWVLMNLSTALEDSSVRFHPLSTAFLGIYLKNIGYRDACFSCPFYQIPRVSDFTIGDLWGAENFAPEMTDGRGISLILLNSEKGKRLFPEIQKWMETKPVSLENAIKQNPNLIRATTRKPQEDAFWEMRKSQPVEKVLRYYGLPPRSVRIKQSIKGVISILLPEKTKTFIKKKILKR